MPRIVDIRESSVAIARYDDPLIPSNGLTTSIVAITTDAAHRGEPVTGFGFSSIGRFAQSGLIRERFAPRLLAAPPRALTNADDTNFDPMRAWNVMMKGEKPGGHGERCVAVGTLDMAIWDAAAKIADLPLYAFIRRALGLPPIPTPAVSVYAGGGYRFPTSDVEKLIDETQRARQLGYTHMKVKIGSDSLSEDIVRVEAAASVLGSPERLAVDAMNAYDLNGALRAASALNSIGCWWFEDVTDPLDFAAWSEVARQFPPPLAAGEALFSPIEAELLAQHGGLRPDRDILVFDPVHTYGLPGYLSIVDRMERRGWPRTAWWPHGGHLFSIHVSAALGLAGSELNPFSFQPFGGVADDMAVVDGRVAIPSRPGIGWEYRTAAGDLFATLNEARRIF